MPFEYKQKYISKNSPSSFIKANFDNSIYTTVPVNENKMDFHISMERYPIYIKNTTNNLQFESQDKSEYSLSKAGITVASIGETKFKVNSQKDEKLEDNNSYRAINEVENVSFFIVKEFTKSSDSYKRYSCYANEDEEAEIGFNVVGTGKEIRGYSSDEEFDFDTTIDDMEEDWKEEQRKKEEYDKIYEEKRNKNKKNDVNQGYSDDYDDDPTLDPSDYQSNTRKRNKTKTIKEGKYIENNMNFIKQLKEKKIINDFTFSFLYDKDQDKGEILIGGLPHELYPSKYNSDYYFYDKILIQREPPYNWEFTYDKLLYGNEEIAGIKSGKLSIDFGYIEGSLKAEEFLNKNFFSQNSANCFSDNYEDYKYYYCKDEKVIKTFKPIKFTIQMRRDKNEDNLNNINNIADIIFDYNDLFIKDKITGYYFFQIIFNPKRMEQWKFGKPLFKKYLMVFNQDKKIYGFYFKEGGISKRVTVHYTWFIIVILLVGLGVLGYLLYKNIIKLPRRLKANELEDSFDYHEANSKDKLNGGIKFKELVINN